MELSTIIGLVAGAAVVVIGIITGGGELSSFWDPGSIFITLGGSACATLVAYPFSDLKSLVKIIGKTMKSEKQDMVEVINQIITLANIARKEGLLALEESANNMSDPFLKKGIMLIVDGTDGELVKGILEAEIAFLQQRHAKGQGILDTLAALSPAFGMLGTLIGLINMLKNLNDADSLGAGMAVALVTTFYGSVLANMIFIPMSSKLKVFSAREVLRKEIMLEGMLSIQAGENPRVIEEKLYSFLPRDAKEKAPVTTGVAGVES